MQEDDHRGSKSNPFYMEVQCEHEFVADNTDDKLRIWLNSIHSWSWLALKRDKNCDLSFWMNIVIYFENLLFHLEMIGSSKVCVWGGEAIASRSCEIWNTSRQAPLDAISAASNCETNAMWLPHKLLNGTRDSSSLLLCPPQCDYLVCAAQWVKSSINTPPRGIWQCDFMVISVHFCMFVI